MTRLPAAAVGAGVAAAVLAALRRRPPQHPRWQRANFRDRPVTLAGGPALATGAGVACLVSGAPAAGVAALLGGGLGLYDDLYGDSHARGLRGHVTALGEGRVTTGLVKLAGLTGAGLAVAVGRRSGRGAAPGELLADTLMVAATANLVNLFDLRPGRALKVVALTGALLAACAGPAGAAAAGVLGAAGAVLPADLGEQVMIGDCGANAAGAALGACVAMGTGRAAKSAALGLIVALTLASERVSFTEVIAGQPWLRAADEWGRTA